MSLKEQIKKLVCIMLIMLISFILAMNQEVYSSSLEDPIILEPTDSQYLELRAIRVNEIEGADYQVIMQLWAHGLETTGFTFRLGFDETILQPSSLVDNSYTDDNLEYFEFENGLENHMDALGTSEESSSMLFMVSLLNNSESDNQYIVEKEGVGKVLDSTTEDVLIGKMSFRSTSKTLAEDAIILKTSTTASPKTGIKVMANQYDYYENQKLFKFTQNLVSTNAKLSNLTTDLKEITDFNRDKYEYTIQINADKTEITILPTPEEPTSTITINGEEVDVSTGKAIRLSEFSEMTNKTVIEVLVTAEDGKSTQTYKITVEKQGGFVQGMVRTVNTTGTHTATIKIFRSDQYIDWKNTNSTELDEYEMAAQVETEIDGIFQVALPIGKYDILIDKPGYLDYIVKGVEIYQQHTTSIGTKQIVAGDVNKDGIIKATDQSAILKVYGKTDKTSEYNIKYDFIEDGTIKATDYSILLKNYGKSKTIETTN